MCRYPLEYTEGFSQPCVNPLCTTYKSVDGSKCPNPQNIRVPSMPGCICMKDYAQISEGVCAQVGTCECPKVASLSDSNVYSQKGTPNTDWHESAYRLIG